MSWLNIYMQIAYLDELYEMLLPQYPQQIFVQIAEVRMTSILKCFLFLYKNVLVNFLSSLSQLLDLCVLDVGCLEYTYAILAASALYHFSSCELMQRVSGKLHFLFFSTCSVELPFESRHSFHVSFFLTFQAMNCVT